MKTFQVLLSSINDVKNFVNIVSKYDYEIDLISVMADDFESLKFIFLVLADAALLHCDLNLLRRRVYPIKVI